MNHRHLQREVAATLIPNGDAVNLPVGIPVDITHRLGGHFTIVCELGMFRIDGKDADALDEPIPESVAAEDSVAKSSDEPADEKAIWEALKAVYDPEIPVNIVDLGLVYSVQMQQGDTGCKVDVKMTLTAPGCGMGPVIAEDARGQIAALKGIEAVEVELVWDPPWTQDMISEAGQMELGLI